MCLKIVQEWLMREFLLFVLLTPTGTGFMLSRTGSQVAVYMNRPPPLSPRLTNLDNVQT
jgi:hypothetical protein